MSNFVQYVPPAASLSEPMPPSPPKKSPVPKLSVPLPPPAVESSRAPLPANVASSSSSVPVYTAEQLLSPSEPPPPIHWADAVRAVSATLSAGKGSRDLAHQRASSQFIDFMPPKTSDANGAAKKLHDGRNAASLVYSWPAQLAPKFTFNHKAALLGASGNSSGQVVDGSGHGSTALVAANAPTTALQMQMQLAGLGLDPRAFSHLNNRLAAGLTCEMFQERVARTRLDRRLQDPTSAPPKKAYARRASTAFAQNIMYGGPAAEETSIVDVSRKARRSLCLQPQVASLLGMRAEDVHKLVERHNRRPSVATIRMLQPKLFADAAGLSSNDCSRVGGDSLEYSLHKSVLRDETSSEPLLDAAQMKARRCSLDMRLGSELGDMLVEQFNPADPHADKGRYSSNQLQHASSAPEEMFAGAAGVNSHYLAKIRTSDGYFLHKESRKSDLGDEAKQALYGGGPSMAHEIGNGQKMAELQRAARRPSIVRTQPAAASLYEGAAGTSSKQSFFSSDWSSGHHFFSENLHFRPVGVKGLGTDAKPKVLEGAAGLSSKALFQKEADNLGLMGDDRRDARRGSVHVQLSHDEIARAIEAESTALNGGGVIYLGESECGAHNGISQMHATEFKGAAGLTTHDITAVQLRGLDVESLGQQNDAMRYTKMSDVDGESLKYRRASQAVASSLPKAPKHARRGSAMHSEGLTVLGGSVLQAVRSNQQSKSGPTHGARQWDNMPPAFEGAAGLSSNTKNWIDNAADPVVREITRQRAEDMSDNVAMDDASRRSARRGSALHHAGFAILGSDELSELRAKGSEAMGPSSDDKTLAWDGMPPSFCGAAGLSTKATSETKVQGTPDADAWRPRLNHSAIRRMSPRSEEAIHFDGAAGLTSHEVAVKKQAITMNSSGRIAVGGHRASRVMRGDDPMTDEEYDHSMMVDEVEAPYDPRATSPSRGRRRSVDIPAAFPTAFAGAAGLTSSQAADRRSRNTMFLEVNAAEKLNQQLASWAGVIEAQREMDRRQQLQGQVGHGSHFTRSDDPTARAAWSAGQGDLSGRGGGASPRGGSSPILHRDLGDISDRGPSNYAHRGSKEHRGSTHTSISAPAYHHEDMRQQAALADWQRNDQTRKESITPRSPHAAQASPRQEWSRNNAAPASPRRGSEGTASQRRGSDEGTISQLRDRALESMGAGPMPTGGSAPSTPRGRAASPPPLFERFTQQAGSPRADTSRSFLDSYWSNFPNTLGGQRGADSQRGFESPLATPR